MTDSVTQLVDKFTSFLSGVGAANASLKPITDIAAVATKVVVQTTEAEAPVLVTHELDVIAAHNPNHPLVSSAAGIARLLFSMFLATTPTTPAAVPAAPAAVPLDQAA